MSLLTYGGCEGGAVNPWTTAHQIIEDLSSGSAFCVGTAMTAQASGARSGDYCWRAPANAQSQLRINKGRVSDRSYWIGAAFKFGTNFPSVLLTILSNQFVAIRCTTTGTLRMDAPAGTLIGAETSALSLNTWYYVELESNISSTGNEIIRFWLDGTLISEDTATNYTATLSSNFDVGPAVAYGAGRTIDIDDIYLCDDQGSAPFNSRLGPVSVHTCLPISDVAGGSANWRKGDGVTTTNKFSAIASRPPNGEATTGTTVESQLENAASATNDGQTFNFASMDTAGVPSGNEVLATRLMAQTSASNTTGTTDGGLEILSTDGHPAVSKATQDWIPTAVAAAYPTGWHRMTLPSATNSFTLQPTITDRSVSPQVRITKEIANTRVLAICHLRLDVLSRTAAAGDTPKEGSDSFALSESAASSISSGQLDSFALSEAASVTSVQFVTGSENFTFSDTNSGSGRQPTDSRQPTDTLLPTGVWASVHILASVAAALESFSLSDTASVDTTGGAVQKTGSESFLLGDVSSLLGQPTAAEGHSFSDLAAISAALARSDSATVAEAAASGLSFNASDSMTLTEAAATATALSASDALTLTEAYSLLAQFSVSEGHTLSNETAAILASLTGSDASVVTDLSSIASTTFKTASDSWLMSDLSTLGSDVQKIASDSLTSSEAAVISSALSASDSLSQTEVTALTNALIGASEEFSQTEVAAALATVLSASDDATLSEISLVAATLFLNQSDAFTFLDSASADEAAPASPYIHVLPPLRGLPDDYDLSGVIIDMVAQGAVTPNVALAVVAEAIAAGIAQAAVASGEAADAVAAGDADYHGDGTNV